MINMGIVVYFEIISLIMLLYVIISAVYTLLKIVTNKCTGNGCLSGICLNLQCAALFFKMYANSISDSFLKRCMRPETKVLRYDMHECIVAFGQY